MRRFNIKIILGFFLLLMLPMGCNNKEDSRDRFRKEFMPDETTLEEGIACGTAEDDKLYKLAEVYFDNDEILTFNLSITYFANGGVIPNDSFFYNRVEEMSDFFMKSGAKIKFKLKYIDIINNSPVEDSIALSYIKKIEFINNNGNVLKTLRGEYKMAHYKLWNKVYHKQNTINMFVYNQSDLKFAGIAGGIPSTFFAVAFQYLDDVYKTSCHEVGHCLNLYHTFTYDKSRNNCNTLTGDRIGDTYKSPLLSGLITDSCQLNMRWKYIVESDYYKSYNNPNLLDSIPPAELEKLIDNVMSYTHAGCRTEFTEGQILRMKFSIENSEDLRRCIEGLGGSESDLLWNDLIEVE